MVRRGVSWRGRGVVVGVGVAWSWAWAWRGRGVVVAWSWWNTSPTSSVGATGLYTSRWLSRMRNTTERTLAVMPESACSCSKLYTLPGTIVVATVGRSTNGPSGNGNPVRLMYRRLLPAAAVGTLSVAPAAAGAGAASASASASATLSDDGRPADLTTAGATTVVDVDAAASAGATSPMRRALRARAPSDCLRPPAPALVPALTPPQAAERSSAAAEGSPRWLWTTLAAERRVAFDGAPNDDGHGRSDLGASERWSIGQGGREEVARGGD